MTAEIAILLGVTILSFFYFIIKEYKEIIYLKKTLKKINGRVRISSKEDLIKIKNYLNKAISYNSELKLKRRPILRYTASQILKSKYGFCGENARVAIKLFLLGGIKANRIYLFRKEWEHVLIEHEFKGKHYMFDGHYDEDTLLKDNDVISILSENISKYPDQYPNNPYLDFCRIKLFYKTPFLGSLSKIRLPSLLTYMLESPYLIKAAFLLFLLFVIVMLFMILS